MIQNKSIRWPVIRSLTSRDLDDIDRIFNNRHLIALWIKLEFVVVLISAQLLFLTLGLIAFSKFRWSGDRHSFFYRHRQRLYSILVSQPLGLRHREACYTPSLAPGLHSGMSGFNIRSDFSRHESDTIHGGMNTISPNQKKKQCPTMLWQNYTPMKNES